MEFVFLKKISGAALLYAGLLQVTIFKNVHNGPLFLVIFLFMVADLLTGIAKARLVHKEQITSSGLRRTVAKFIQYFFAITLVYGLAYATKEVAKNNAAYTENFAPYVQHIITGVIILVIYIEAVSVLENLIAIDKKSPFSGVLRAIHSLLTFTIKNNPLSKKADAINNTSEKNESNESNNS